MPGKKPTHTGCDATKEATGIKHEISIHAPHTGRDSVDRAPSFGTSTFQSTRPIRGATLIIPRVLFPVKNFNPRAPYGARQKVLCREGGVVLISIHAPHTGRDRSCRRAHIRTRYFNPRAPYGARQILALAAALASQFQSTRPIRGATWLDQNQHNAERNFNPRAPYGARLSGRPCVRHKPGNFNPRAPYGARLEMQDRCARYAEISIHAPHTGHDKLVDKGRAAKAKFQSTRPIRGTTFVLPGGDSPEPFQSTRPIRGTTLSAASTAAISSDFNPRAPYGARHRSYGIRCRGAEFQSTRPIRGTTLTRLFHFLSPKFQSTRPIRGATSVYYGDCLVMQLFQSTRPIRGATISRRHRVISHQ